MSNNNQSKSEYYQRRRDEVTQTLKEVELNVKTRLAQSAVKFDALESSLGTICISIALAAIPLTTSNISAFKYPQAFFMGIGILFLTGIWIFMNARDAAQEAVMTILGNNSKFQVDLIELKETYNDLILAPNDKDLLLKVEAVKHEMAQEIEAEDNQSIESSAPKNIRGWRKLVSNDGADLFDGIFTAMTISLLLMAASIWRGDLYILLLSLLGSLLVLLFWIAKGRQKRLNTEKKFNEDKRREQASRLRRLDAWKKRNAN